MGKGRGNGWSGNGGRGGSNSGAPGTIAYVFIALVGKEGWVAHFDDGAGVPIGKSVALYHLLTLLCGPTSRVNPASREVVAFKTAGELMEAIGALEGRSVTRHCLNQRISRLAKIMSKCGFGHLLESGPQGYRIRLRRGGRVVDRSAAQTSPGLEWE